eukprot:gene9071-10039_t
MAELIGNPSSSINIIGVDVGSTTISCYIFDEHGKKKGKAIAPTILVHPKQGYTEIDPVLLWDTFVAVTKESFKSANITAADVTAFGISTQRGSFITWDRDTGEPLHNFIGWQDLRAADLSDQWNNSFTMRAIKSGSKLLFRLTGSSRYKAASVINFAPNHTSMRLLWLLNNDPVIYQKAHNGTLMFGTIDSWLIWKLSGCKTHLTDYSNASSTGIFDPYMMEWSSFFCKLLGFPSSIFPKIVDTSGVIINVDEDIFGSSFPITALAADQQASVFGQCCFDEGDINCTLGTGTFIDINTGSTPHATLGGIYPLVGWKIGESITFVAEGCCSGTASSVEWSKNVGLFNEVSETSDMAFSVEDSDGVCFVPAFHGLEAPFNDHNAGAMLIGLKNNTAKCHIMRAVLESISFRFYQLYQSTIDEIRVPVTSSIKADGGVTNNDFVMELTASLTDHIIDRSSFQDMSALGAAFFAGLGAGVWKSKDDLKKLRKSTATFKPNTDTKKQYNSVFKLWTKAAKRSLRWYENN